MIVVEDFVSADDGTGVVHMAPAFGADDYQAGKRHGLAFLQPVNGRGEFPASLPVVGGLHVKKADPAITVVLEERGVLWKAGTLVHSYPHCWRCGTPLLYYARESWFVSTTSFKRSHDGAQLRASTGIRQKWARGDSANGSRTTSTGRSRAIATGARRCRSGCAIADSAHAVAIGCYAELAERIGEALARRTSIRTSRSSTRTRSRAITRSAAGR